MPIATLPGMGQTAEESFKVALRHLERVDAAWFDPTDWMTVAFSGFYCLEACVVAASLHLGWNRPGQHRKKVRAAERLNRDHDLPDIGDLLIVLNTMRKHEAYGDIDRPEGLDPEDIAAMIDEYVKAVRQLMEQ